MSVGAYTTLDRMIIAVTAVTVVWIFTGSLSVENGEMQGRLAIAFGALYCSLLVARMVGGGASSRIWNWLPPLWPWGLVVKSSTGRWIVVLALVAGTTAGIVSMLLFPVAT
jgi:hypothetical protein